jgi:ribosomal protein S18 acetylase RimI-like enzyme
MITFNKVSRPLDIQQILDLQKENLPQNISMQEAIEQGFLTVQHDFALLEKMNALAPSVIAQANDKVVGYCLAMLTHFQQDIPVLVPMFEIFQTIDYQGKKLSNYAYLVMGQVCVSKDYRGQGIFDKLYEHLKDSYKNTYELMLTEVATRNTRSMRAHERVGLQNVHEYASEDGEKWAVMVWDWR